MWEKPNGLNPGEHLNIPYVPFFCASIGGTSSENILRNTSMNINIFLDDKRVTTKKIDIDIIHETNQGSVDLLESMKNHEKKERLEIIEIEKQLKNINPLTQEDFGEAVGAYECKYDSSRVYDYKKAYYFYLNRTRCNNELIKENAAEKAKFWGRIYYRSRVKELNYTPSDIELILSNELNA